MAPSTGDGEASSSGRLEEVLHRYNIVASRVDSQHCHLTLSLRWVDALIVGVTVLVSINERASIVPECACHERATSASYSSYLGIYTLQPSTRRLLRRRSSSHGRPTTSTQRQRVQHYEPVICLLNSIHPLFRGLSVLNLLRLGARQRPHGDSLTTALIHYARPFTGHHTAESPGITRGPAALCRTQPRALALRLQPVAAPAHSPAAVETSHPGGQVPARPERAVIVGPYLYILLC